MAIDDLSTGSITLKSPDGTKVYLLVGTVSYFDGVEDVTEEISCVDSYTMCGGPGVPFEYISLRIPKKKLVDVSSDFREPNAIIAGKSRLDVDYYGKCMNMCVTKCTSSENHITIVAYHECEILRGLTTDTAMSGDPFQCIQSILIKLDTFLGYAQRYSSSEGGLRLCYDTTKDTFLNTAFSIPAGTNLWTALQILAYTIGCKVFFAENFVYIVDFTLPMTNYTSATLPFPLDLMTVDLFLESNQNPFYGNVVGKPSYGEEGFDTVKNSIVIEGMDTVVVEGDSENPAITMKSVNVSDENSIRTYGLRQGGTINTSFLPLKYCGLFGQTYLKYLAQPQQSITFTVKEVSSDATGSAMKWHEAFHVLTRICHILNSYDDVSTINKDNLGNTIPQLQFLDIYERNYPEGTSTYTFGVMESISLSQSTSSILTALSSQTNYI